MPADGEQLAALDQRLTVSLTPGTPPGQRGLGPGNPLPPGANPFAYELMGATPPAAIATAKTGAVVPTAAGGTAALPAAAHTHRKHDGVMAPVSPMLGSHVTERETDYGVS